MADRRISRQPAHTRHGDAGWPGAVPRRFSVGSARPSRRSECFHRFALDRLVRWEKCRDRSRRPQCPRSDSAVVAGLLRAAGSHLASSTVRGRNVGGSRTVGQRVAPEFRQSSISHRFAPSGFARGRMVLSVGDRRFSSQRERFHVDSCCDQSHGFGGRLTGLQSFADSDMAPVTTGGMANSTMSKMVGSSTAHTPAIR